MHQYSNLAHVPWAIAIQLVGVGLFAAVQRVRPAHLWICGLGGFSVIFSREVTQAEYRYIEAHGGLRANMPDLVGFEIWRWNQHSVFETAFAGIAVVTVAMIGSILARSR